MLKVEKLKSVCFIKNKDTAYSVRQKKQKSKNTRYNSNVRIDNNDQKKIQRILNYRIKKTIP